MKLMYSAVFFASILINTSAHADQGFLCDPATDYSSSNVQLAKDELSISLGSNSVEVLPVTEGNMKGTLDSKYKPRKGHEGAIQFNLDNGCNKLIIDRGMQKDGYGHATFVMNCANEGGYPAYYVFSCNVQ